MKMSQQAIKVRIRVAKQDAAFVYATLEAHEGLAAYSTLDSAPADTWRRLECVVPATAEEDLRQVFSEIGGIYYEL